MSRFTSAYEKLPLTPTARARVWRSFTNLGKIERHNHRLDAATLRQCCDYAADVFGPKDRYARELAIYASVHGRFREGWIPETYFIRQMARRRSGAIYISREKTLSGYFLRDDPALPDLAYISDGFLFARDWTPVPWDKAAEVLFAGGRDAVIYKANLSFLGRDVMRIGRREVEDGLLRQLGNGCIQRLIVPHPEVPFGEMTAVTTLRLVTTRDAAGEIGTRFALQRIGRGTDTHLRGDESVKTIVSLDTGALNPQGYLSDWTPVTAHPDTGESFAGRVYPQIEAAKALCLRLHRKMPAFLSIGWDLCLDRSGEVLIMEWNQGHAITFGEAVQGPNFADLIPLHTGKGPRPG